MAIDVRRVGQTVPAAGRPAVPFDRVSIDHAHGRLTLLTLGATLETCETPDARGDLGHVHLALPDAQDYADLALNPHLGSSIGRYANRIAHARFTLDGVDYRLDANRGDVTLHGGTYGWDRQAWELVEATERDGEVVVEMLLVSPDGDMGFPGTVTATARYVVSGPRIRIDYEATTDARTVVGMTNHAYWNLSGEPTVHAHGLQLAAGRILPYDGTSIPSGPPVAVVGPLDLRRRTVLGPAIAAVEGGIDHCYVVDEARPDDDGLRPVAVLDAPASGRWMTVRSDAPGVQVYTGNGLRAPFGEHQAVCLETQRLPDAPNQDYLGPCVLDPGDTYASATLLEFGVGDPPPLAPESADVRR